MAKVFGILTAIVLALSAFIAFKNKAQYETQALDVQARKESLTASQTRLKAIEAELAASPAERAGVEAEVEKLTAEEAVEKKTNDEINAKIDAATAKIASNKEQLAGIREKTSKIGDLKESASKLRADNAELEELDRSIAASEAKLANLTSEKSSSEAQVNEAKGKFESFSSGQSLPSLKTRIRSIYPNWGFVTLASGNNAGVIANSTLNVVRDGNTVAKLLVTAVESNSSSASIVPDSMAQDATLMVGDRVVPGLKASKPASN